MKTIILNASPRKNWNTAQLLKEAQKGAESVGSEVEYIDLYDLNYTGCRSCLACKRKGAEPCKCYWKDDLSPLIDKILRANAVIIGSPIYFGEPTAQFRALYERLIFCIMSYDSHANNFNGKVNVGLIYTMNAPKNYFEAAMHPTYNTTESLMGFLGGKVMTYASCDTVQVADYSKYDMSAFSEEAKKAHHDAQFPIDLQAAFNMGADLSK